MNTIQWICTCLLTALTVLYAYLAVYAVIGALTTRRFAPARKLHRYAVVISARNEETVIANLLESIRSQTYPQSLLTVFVVADNCTDRTAQLARLHGAIVYERRDPLHRTKGYALQYLFRCIQKDYGIRTFDGYLVLDADNTLKEDYMQKMNDAFDSGEKIITSYRNTRNISENAVAASYAIHWLRTIRMEHRARSVLHLATRITGTGFLFSNELVRDGWNFTSLTEDRAFCADAALKGYSISYQNEAQFFDEQPSDLQIAMRQRIRWAKGNLLAFTEYGPKLLKQMLKTRKKKRFLLYDMLLITFPLGFIRLLLSAVCTLTGTALWFLSSDTLHVSALVFAAVPAAAALLSVWLRQTILAAYIIFSERKNLPQLPLLRWVRYCMTFCIFDWMGSLAFCIAAVSKVDWKPIPHKGTSSGESSSEETKTSISYYTITASAFHQKLSSMRKKKHAAFSSQKQ